MPNKTIYIRDEDLDIYSKAKKLAGTSFSAIIASSLRTYVEQEERRRFEMQEYRLKVGQKNDSHTERFIGKKLFDWSGTLDDKSAWVQTETFLTDDNRLAICVSYWPQKRLSHLKPESTSLYVDNLDGSNFNWISGDFALQLLNAKDSLRIK